MATPLEALMCLFCGRNFFDANWMLDAPLVLPLTSYSSVRARIC